MLVHLLDIIATLPIALKFTAEFAENAEKKYLK